jgi:hypothetical protein
VVAYTAPMGSVSLWEGIFMLVVLKIPMLYLAAVVWWAIRAEPHPGRGSEAARAFVPLTPCGWDEWRRRHSSSGRPLRPRPHGPGMRPARRPGVGVSA